MLDPTHTPSDVLLPAVLSTVAFARHISRRLMSTFLGRATGRAVLYVCCPRRRNLNIFRNARVICYCRNELGGPARWTGTRSLVEWAESLFLRQQRRTGAGENSSKSLQLVCDAGAPETTPELSLIARNDRLTRGLLDLVGNF